MAKSTKTEDAVYQENDTVSMGECTGIMPAALENAEQAENYGELYGIHSPKSAKEGQEHGLGAKNAEKPKLN